MTEIVLLCHIAHSTAPEREEAVRELLEVYPDAQVVKVEPLPPECAAERTRLAFTSRALDTERELLTMGPQHPCYLGGGDWAHDWEFRDDSFDHEFGCEQVFSYECSRCAAEAPWHPEDEDLF